MEQDPASHDPAAGGEILNAIFRSDVIGCDIFGKSVYQIFFRRYPGRKTSLLKGM